MTILWLIVWLLSDAPHISFVRDTPQHAQAWAIALAVCAAIDLFEVLGD